MGIEKKIKFQIMVLKEVYGTGHSDSNTLNRIDLN